MTWFMTPLFLALVLIEGVDILFVIRLGAGDLRDYDRPFMVDTSNIFEIPAYVRSISRSPP